MKRKKAVKSVPALGTTARGRRSALRINKVRRAFHPERSARGAAPSSGARKDPVARASASTSGKSVQPKKGRPARDLKRTASSSGGGRGKKSRPAQPAEPASPEPVDKDKSKSNKKVSRALKMLAIDFVESRVKPLQASSSSSSATISSQTKARKSSGAHSLGGSDKSENSSRKTRPTRPFSPSWRKTHRRSLGQSRPSISPRRSSQTSIASSAVAPARSTPKIGTRKSRLTITRRKPQRAAEDGTVEEARSLVRRSASKSRPGDSTEDNFSPARSRSRSKARLNKSECMDVDTTESVSVESLSQSVRKEEDSEAEEEPKSKLSGVISTGVNRGRSSRSSLTAGIVRRAVLRGKTTARTVFRGRGSMTRGNRGSTQARPKVPTSAQPEKLYLKPSATAPVRSRIIRKSRVKSESGGASADAQVELESDSEEIIKTEDTPVSRGRGRTRLISSESDSLIQNKDLEADVAMSKSMNDATSKTAKLKKKRIGAFSRRSYLKKELSVSMECLLQDKLAALDQGKEGHSRSSSPGGIEARVNTKLRSAHSVDLARSSSLDDLHYGSVSAKDQKHFLMPVKHVGSGDGVQSSSSASQVDMKKDVFLASFGTKGFYGSVKRKQAHDSGSQDERGKRQRLMARLKDISTEQIPSILYSSRVPRVPAFGQSPATSRESSPGSLHKIKDLNPKEETELDKPSSEPLSAEARPKDRPKGRPKKNPPKEPSFESLISTSDASGWVADLNSSVSDTSLRMSTSVTSCSTQTDIFIPKRPRGRPRIHPFKPKIKTGRGRGRPKGSRNKKTLEEEAKKPSEKSQPVKCKQGRPSMKDLVLRKGMNYTASYMASQQSADTAEHLQSAAVRAVPSTSSVTSQSTTSKEPLSDVTEEAMDVVPFSESESMASSSQPSSSQESPPKDSKVAKSRSLQLAVANRRRECPTVRQMRMNRRRLKKSRWASGRLPKQSATAIGKMPRKSKPVSSSSGLQKPKEDNQGENVIVSPGSKTPVSLNEVDAVEVSIPSTDTSGLSTSCSEAKDLPLLRVEATDANQEHTMPNKPVDDSQPDRGLNKLSVTQKQHTDTSLTEFHTEEKSADPDDVVNSSVMDISNQSSAVDDKSSQLVIDDSSLKDEANQPSTISDSCVEDYLDQLSTVSESCVEDKLDQANTIDDSSVPDISEHPEGVPDSSAVDKSDQTSSKTDPSIVDQPDQPSTVTETVPDSLDKTDVADKADRPSASVGSLLVEQANQASTVSDSPVVEQSGHPNLSDSPPGSLSGCLDDITEVSGDDKLSEQPNAISDCHPGHANMSVSSLADHSNTVSDLSVHQPVHLHVPSDSHTTDQPSTISDLTLADQSQPQTDVASHSQISPSPESPSTVQSSTIPNLSENVSSEMKNEDVSLIPASVDQSNDASAGEKKAPETEAPKPKWRQSQELKRLQRDEGVQKIMSWHEKKKLKSIGLLLRSKTKDADEVHMRPVRMRPSAIRKRGNKLYSVDTISDTRLLLKVGQPAERREDPPQTYSMWDQQGQLYAAGTDYEMNSKAKQSIPSMYPCSDGEHGPPPLITEVTPFKDNRLERCRSEELSPPPLIRPEDPYSEDYFVSMPLLTSNARSRLSETVTCDQESGKVDSSIGTKADGRTSDSGIDALQGMDASGAKAASVTPGLKKKRGRPAKRKNLKMGPASKTGREPHVQSTLKLDRKPKIKTTVKIDTSCIQSTSHLSQPRTFALRPKTTRSPIEIIAMRQKQEEEEYELAEATRRARILKRRQAHMDKIMVPCDPSSQMALADCRPCSVILVDFVKELHLNFIDTSDQYVSDVSFDSDEKDLDDDDYSADYDPELDEADVWDEEEQEKLAGRSKLPAKDLIHRKICGASYLVSRKQTAATKHKETLQPPKREEFLEPAQPKKPALDLESMKGKSFMGNFVDFIQNRDNPAPILKTPPISRFFQKAPTSALVSSVPSSLQQRPITSASSVSDSSDVMALPPGPASAASSSVSSDSQVVTTAVAGSAVSSQLQVQNSEEHVSSGVGMESRDQPAMPEPNKDSVVCPEDKTVSSSPYKASQVTEDVQAPPLSPPKVRPAPEKSVPSGKLKVFPMRRDSDCGAGDTRMAATRYLCTLCDFSATNKGTIESHVYRHIPGVNFKCGYCDSEFTGLVSALTHVKNSHHKEPKVWISKDINEASLYTEEAVPACTESAASKQKAAITKQICESPAVQEAQPVIISLVMSGELPVQRQELFSASPLTTQRRFACTHCSYSTNVVEDANQHVRDLHRGNSLYTCYLCDKAFGCSLQEVEVHCAETHPHRQNSYKKLPDFYDQELMRASSSSGDRGKSHEDRGNIFDRMSNFFPSLGPGGEMTEDGQLSPAARHLRARDYLYIRDGWSVKTSAEADSTTIEDIELPVEDSTEPEGTGLDSTTDEVAPKVEENEQQSSADSLVFSTQPETALSSVGTERQAAADKEDSSQNASGAEIKTSYSHSDQTSATELDSCKETELPAAEVENLTSEEPTPEHQLEWSADHVQESETPAAGGDARVSLSSGPTELHVSAHPSAEDTATSSGNALPATTVSKEPTSETTSARSPGGKTTDPSAVQEDATQREPAAEVSSAQSVPGLAVAPGEVLPDGDADDDAENDILVINLDDDDVMADDESTPDDDKADTSFGDGSADQGDVSTVSHDEEEADDGTGIKILSVVSLRGNEDQLPGDSLSPDKLSSDFHTESLPASPPAPAPSSPTVAPKPVSASSPRPSLSPRRPSGSPRAVVPRVNADDIATRNEKMVCTYKCFKCSVHSPQLSAIVDHLKQYHMDVPLFACPYCSKKVSFYTEEEVHRHVRDKHPSNYAKNEVSLSEVAKSFIQVLAFPSGRDTRDGQVEHDIFMCLECDSHIPDQDYGLRHLKSEHPDLLKYACPTCGMYSDSSEDGVKSHMRSMHGQASESVPLSVAMEGVFLSKVISISHDKQYRDHAAAGSSKGPVQKAMAANQAATPPKSQTLSAAPVGSDAAVNLTPMLNPAGFQAVHVPMDNTTLVASNPISSILLPVQMNQVRLLAPVQQQPVTPDGKSKGGKSKMGSPYPAGSLLAASGAMISPRTILPMPPALAEAAKNLKKVSDMGPRFQKTGITVKNMLDSRQKDNFSAPPHAITAGKEDAGTISTSSPSSPSALSVNTSTSSGAGPSSLSPRGMFSMTDKLDRLGRARRSVSPHSSPSAVATTTTTTTTSKASINRPVLKVPQVAAALNLTSSAPCQDTSTPVDTSVSNTPVGLSPAAARNTKSVPASALPFSIAALTAPAAPRASTSFSMDGSEDPEAFKIFNLKPRVPTLRGPRASGSPAATTAPATSQSSGTASMASPAPPAGGTVTMASSALFPQQFRVQQPPPQPSINTLPIGQGGLPIGQGLAMPLGAALTPFNQGAGFAVPINVTQAQLVMAQNSLAPVVFSTNFLAQIRGSTIPQLAVAGAGTVSAPAAHQQRLTSTQAVNLSLVQPGSPALGNPRPILPSSTPPSPFRPRSSLQNRGKGRPKLHHNPPALQQQQQAPHPSTPAPSPAPTPPPLNQPGTSFQSPLRASSPAPATGASSARPAQQQRHGTQQYVCPYCPKGLRPWEVAQHIQVNHPGEEVKYKRL